MAIDLILGTAGHIDHGKTALVKALTGTDTDRLPEEKRRGITIDLGFAELGVGRFRLGIVDVPGHERFVRNMLAGATGVDLAMLVVAADESIKPQTREHLEILRLLGLKAGVIALTKCDLAEPSWIDLVEEELREFVAGSFLADAPIVRTSAATGQGLDELRAALEDAAERAVAARPPSSEGPFRMAIDRAFAVAGHGTVVTGSVQRGRAAVGDELEVEPGGVRVRVRGIENHGRPAEETHRGQRAAINLAGIHHGSVARGMELASPGHLVPSQRWSAELRLLPSADRPLKHRARVRIHVGAAELMARVALLDRNELWPGETALAQVFLGQPAVASWGQPLVIRSESPVMTIGGGQVLDPAAPKLRRHEPRALGWLEQLARGGPIDRAAATLYFAGRRGWRADDLPRTAGVDEVDAARAALDERGDLVEFAVSPTRVFRLHRESLDELAARVEHALERLHAAQPLQSSFPRPQLASRFPSLSGEKQGGEALFQRLLEYMAGQRRVVLSDRGVALAGRGPQLSAGQRELLDQIVERYRAAGLQPPSVAEVQAEAARHQGDVPKLIQIAAAEGRLVPIAADLLLHAEHEQQMRSLLRERLAQGGMTMSQIRELLGTTRKYAVPFCEYLDRIGLTRREGDLRLLVRSPSP